MTVALYVSQTAETRKRIAKESVHHFLESKYLFYRFYLFCFKRNASRMANASVELGQVFTSLGYQGYGQYWEH